MSQWTKEIEDQMAGAVKWLADRGGSGVQDRYAHVVARGETSTHIPHITWFRCVFSSRLKVEGGRIWTPEALEAMEAKLAGDYCAGLRMNGTGGK